MKIKITCGCFREKTFIVTETKTINATPVTIKGFERLALFVHTNRYNKSIFSQHYGKKYVVTEGSTGLIIEGGKDQKNAIKKTEQFLKTKGIELVERQINIMLAQIKSQ